MKSSKNFMLVNTIQEKPLSLFTNYKIQLNDITQQTKNTYLFKYSDGCKYWTQ